jgi:hypothetical protein
MESNASLWMTRAKSDVSSSADAFHSLRDGSRYQDTKAVARHRMFCVQQLRMGF